LITLLKRNDSKYKELQLAWKKWQCTA